MRDFRSVLYLIGILLCIEAVAMIIPMITDLIYGNSDWQVFLLSSLLSFFIGLVMYLSFKREKTKIKVREAFFLTIISWIVIALFAALPFVYSTANLNYSDAIFESVSGITTTGATTIYNLNELSEGILIWRSLLQWFGGIGIIVLALAILPTLQIGGMQLLHMEHDDPYEKTLPKINQFVFEIFSIYILLTFLCSIMYFVAGMSGFNAITHAMTTISTGGFSTQNDSLAGFNSATIEFISVFFMIVGSLPFVIYLKMTHGDFKSLFKDDQIKLFIFILTFLIIITAYWLYIHIDNNIFNCFRIAAFNITSIMTGTGYTSSNYSAWGSFGIVIMLFIMFIGGCAGSTTGGIKIFRLQLLFRGSITQIKKLTHPHGVFLTSFNNKSVGEDAYNSIMGFFFMYIFIFILSAIVLSFFNLDFLTALSASASAISNVGPGIGSVIGPEGNYVSITAPAKWVLLITMLIGRLELFTFLILLSGSFWRK